MLLKNNRRSCTIEHHWNVLLNILDEIPIEHGLHNSEWLYKHTQNDCFKWNFKVSINTIFARFIFTRTHKHKSIVVLEKKAKENWSTLLCLSYFIWLDRFVCGRRRNFHSDKIDGQFSCNLCYDCHLGRFPTRPMWIIFENKI